MQPTIVSRKQNSGVSRKQQSGLVMLIALIALVAMTLAGIALVRSVDTGNLVAGNLAFKQGTLQEGQRASEAAVDALFGTVPTITDTGNDNLAENYYAVRQAENGKGIPNVLANVGLYPTTFQVQETPPPAGSGNVIRYVIERMCIATGPAVLANCSMASSGKATGGTENEETLEPLGGPLFRVTIRVDGPRNTVSYTQVMLRRG